MQIQDPLVLDDIEEICRFNKEILSMSLIPYKNGLSQSSKIDLQCIADHV